MEKVILYFSAIIVGLLLGLLGGGGSILTVPVFVYFAGLSPEIATGYSLFVVGTTSLVGALTYARKNLLNVPIAVTFFIPSFIAVYFVRRYLLPSIPEEIYTTTQLTISKRFAIMTFFASAMLAASLSMIKNSHIPEEYDSTTRVNYFQFFFQAIFVGFITGIAGAGGGFLIVPTLVLLAHLRMRLAVGTSLLIIAINSLIGFSGDLETLLNIEWFFLLLFTGIAIAGIFIGSYLSEKINTVRLKKGFAWFVMTMSVIIFLIELTKQKYEN